MHHLQMVAIQAQGVINILYVRKIQIELVAVASYHNDTCNIIITLVCLIIAAHKIHIMPSPLEINSHLK